MRTLAPDFDSLSTLKDLVDVKFPGKGSHDLSHHLRVGRGASSNERQHEVTR